jgi:HEAT repeat protein
MPPEHGSGDWRHGCIVAEDEQVAGSQRTGGKTFESRLQDILAPVDSPETRSSIERVMQAGGTSWHGLVEILQDTQQSRELRDTVAWLLPRLGGWRAVPPLLSVATNANDDSELRQECVRQCRFLNHKRAVPALVALLRTDPDPKVREAAAYGLGSALKGREQVTEALLQTLRDRAEDPAVRAQAAEALGDLWDWVGRRPPPFVDDLLAVLEESSAEIRFWAAFALSKLGDERVMPALERLAGSDDRIVPRWWSVKHEALMGIARILERRDRLSEAEAMYRRVLADDLEEVPVFQFDALDDLANLLRNQPGREADARELHRQAMELASRQGFRVLAR